MKIDILCNDGSPMGIGLSDLAGDGDRVGVGGAEQYLLTLCDALHQRGHDITLYNEPRRPDLSPFRHANLSQFVPAESRDILLVFRSPNVRAAGAKGKKIWLSCDQTTVGNFKTWGPTMDKTVCISPFHAEYFARTYNITGAAVIDIPVRLHEYDAPVEKVPFSCMFNSVPSRGADLLAQVWPRIVEQVPEANLTITSGWTLWDGRDDTSRLMPFRMKFAGQKNVNYVGAVKRKELIAIQQRTQHFLNPNRYQELFCIAASEAQVAGAIPVSSATGALATTVMSGVIPGNPESWEWQNLFVEAAVANLRSDCSQSKEISEKARERFSLERAVSEWEKIFSG